MNNKKRIIIYGISVLTLIAVVLGTTYAIFNYTRISGQSSLSTGHVKFSTTGELLIDMKKDFPQDADLSGTNLTNMKNSHKGELTIQSHTTLTNGITYRIYAVRGDDIEGKLRLNDENIKFQLTPNFTSGTNGFTVKTNDYAEPNNLVFDNEGKALLSTGIVKDTTQLTAVTYNYYMWIDGGNTLISSTTKRATLPEGNPSLADTTAGNTVADRYMKNDSTLTEEVTIFPARQEDTGKTVYTTSEFSNGYYNIKILVEAEDKVVVQSPIVKKIIKDLDTETEINFGNISSDTNGKGLYILPGTENDDYPIYYYRGEVDNNVVFGGFCWQMVRTTETGGIKMIYNGVATGDGKTCENTAHDDRIIASSKFNPSNNSPAYVGYMYNQVYAYISGGAATDSVFGKAVEWNGTNYLVIEDTSGIPSTNTTLDANHHYTCGTASTTTCTSVRYYYYNSGSNYYYITLTDGDTIEDALYKMTGNGSSETKTKNASYVLNTTDSTAKTEIENWFKTNLTNEVDASKTNYQEYLEDTIYCNNRSYKTVAGSNPTYEQSGWNPNGGDLTEYLYFGTWNRFDNSNWYSASNIPSMECENVTDQFSVSNTQAKLKYPVGLLTADEIIVAGTAGNSSTANNTYYLYTGNYFWSLSSRYYGNGVAFGFSVDKYGYFASDKMTYPGGLRPVVSLKLGTEFEDGGDGTPTNPYVVKYE